MYRHRFPRESVLPLLLGDHFPHSIALAGSIYCNETDGRAVLRQLLERGGNFVLVLG